MARVQIQKRIVDLENASYLTARNYGVAAEATDANIAEA